jgi:hypothetical protein
MPTLVLSTLALLGCVFLIYVFFHWLRDELNPKRRPKPKRTQAPMLETRRPYTIRKPHGRSV